jgi:hypothetical protein
MLAAILAATKASFVVPTESTFLNCYLGTARVADKSLLGFSWLKRNHGRWRGWLMCGAKHNLRMILAKLRLRYARIGIALRDLLATSIAPCNFGVVINA